MFFFKGCWTIIRWRSLALRNDQTFFLFIAEFRLVQIGPGKSILIYHLICKSYVLVQSWQFSNYNKSGWASFGQNSKTAWNFYLAGSFIETQFHFISQLVATTVALWYFYSTFQKLEVYIHSKLKRKLDSLVWYDFCLHCSSGIFWLWYSRLCHP